MLKGFFQDSDFIVVLQTGFGSGSGFLPLGSGLESDSKKLESEHLCYARGTRALQLFFSTSNCPWLLSVLATDISTQCTLLFYCAKQCNDRNLVFSIAIVWVGWSKAAICGNSWNPTRNFVGEHPIRSKDDLLSFPWSHILQFWCWLFVQSKSWWIGRKRLL